MHSQNYAHRDIKLENMLIDEYNCIKIIDFGFSCAISSQRLHKILCGTPCYMSPELVSKQKYNPASVDIWALGILFYRMLTGVFPFSGMCFVV